MKATHSTDDLIRSLAAAYESPNETSIRTTFKLSKLAMDNLDELSEHEGINQKNTIEAMVKLLLSPSLETEKTLTDMLVSFAKEAPTFDGVRKTYVISNRANTILSKASSEYEIERDRLLDYTIKMYLAVVKHQRATESQIRKTAEGKLTKIIEIWESLNSDEIGALQNLRGVDELDFFLSDGNSFMTWLSEVLIPEIQAVDSGATKEKQQ